MHIVVVGRRAMLMMMMLMMTITMMILSHCDGSSSRVMMWLLMLELSTIYFFVVVPMLSTKNGFLPSPTRSRLDEWKIISPHVQDWVRNEVLLLSVLCSLLFGYNLSLFLSHTFINRSNNTICNNPRFVEVSFLIVIQDILC